MTPDDALQTSPDQKGPSASVDPAAIETTSEIAKWGFYKKRRELYVKSDRAAREGAGILAGLLALAAAVWAVVSAMLLNPPDLVCGECAPNWFRWLQAILADVSSRSVR